MKTTVKILTFLMIIAYVVKANAQVPVDEDTKKITYKDVITQDGTPEKLYNQGISWVNTFYKNPSEATRVRDADNHKIEIRHRFQIWNKDKDGNKVSDAGIIEYELTIEFKDGRYRYTMTEFILKQTSKFPIERWLDKNDPQYKPECDDYLKQIDIEANAIIKSLIQGMKIKEIKEDNW